MENSFQKMVNEDITNFKKRYDEAKTFEEKNKIFQEEASKLFIEIVLSSIFENKGGMDHGWGPTDPSICQCKVLNPEDRNYLLSNLIDDSGCKCKCDGNNRRRSEGD